MPISKSKFWYLVFAFILPLALCNLTPAQAGPVNKARYISLAPSTTEILFALGNGDNIVGISSYCNYPPETKNKARVGDFSHPVMEKIISLKPDYIFCTGLEQEQTVKELRRFGLKVYVADPASIEELLESIREIGKITKRDNEAQSLIKKMRGDINSVKEKAALVPADKKTRVFVEIWHEPLMTAGNGSFIDEMISIAGGINIAHDLKRPYSSFSFEKVVSSNPKVIILAYMDNESPLKLLSGRLGWENIDAVKNKQVFNDIDPDILLRPGPRMTEGLKQLQNKLYP
ncbi:MAG: cobalamin-binding protein [Candidatus Omnitrophica bacterium]|nr:cobalamin-binding protein [Candidatus Omnitrophota bacterium]